MTVAWVLGLPGECWSDARTTGTVSGPSLTSSGIAWLQGSDQVAFDDRPPLAIPRRSGTRLDVVDDVLVLRRFESRSFPVDIRGAQTRVVELGSSAGPLAGPVQRLEGGARQAVGGGGWVYAAGSRGFLHRFTPDGRGVEQLPTPNGNDNVATSGGRLLRRIDRIPWPFDPHRPDSDRMEVVDLRSGVVVLTIPRVFTMADGQIGGLAPTDLRSDGSVLATGFGSNQASVVVFGADGSGPRFLLSVPFDSNQRVGLQAKWSGSGHVVVSGPRPVGLQRIDLRTGERKVIATTSSGRVRPRFDAEESSDRVAWRQRACASILQRVWTPGDVARPPVPEDVCRLPTRRVVTREGPFKVELEFRYPLRVSSPFESSGPLVIDIESSAGLRLPGRRSRGPLNYGGLAFGFDPLLVTVNKTAARLLRRNPRRSIRLRVADSEATYETVVRTRPG